MSKYRWVIAFDNWCWVLAEQREGKKPIGRRFFKGFVHLLKYLPEFNVNFDEAINNIISSLEKNTGIKSDDLILDIKNISDVETIGKKIDDFFQTNYLNENHNPSNIQLRQRIYVRVLKADLKNLEKEDE